MSNSSSHGDADAYVSGAFHAVNNIATLMV